VYRVSAQYIWLLIPIWIAWEHWHTLWDLTWTWLTLGNVFAFNQNWIQWYEFTGTSGGTLWILATNFLIFNTLKNKSAEKILSKPIIKIAAIIIVPIFISYVILLVEKPLHQKTKAIQTVVVQPNIDPYNSKFSLDYQSQFFKVLRQIKGEINSETEYLVLPETFITENLNEETINASQEIRWFRDSLINRFPNLKIITGGNTYVIYHNEKDITATARKDAQDGLFFDVYNTAIQIDAVKTQVYHKSKLVPGVERMPFPALLKPLEKLAINMGGTMGSLGTQEDRAVFANDQNKDCVAPVVCYESVYADYVADYVRKGANLIFIITNDGWWENTPGYIQHLNYAKLRAIENRRQIARSANTGISCFIDEFGTISNATNWWEDAVIEKNMYKNNELTFFSRFGDLISYSSFALSILLILWAIILRFKK
jgi:apolipoprotein N-acyltransferase